MSKIKDIRAALAAAMVMDGLSTEAYVRDNADVPVAMISGPDIEYDKTFGRGHDDYTFGVIVLVQRTADEEGQAQLDAYIDPYGTSSLKAAIEADSTLGGVVEDLRVERTQEYGAHEYNGGVYLAAELHVHVMASGKA